ncbi:hypothetical protein BaRGS_00014785, partial [Batillaria attramentaria]
MHVDANSHGDGTTPVVIKRRPRDMPLNPALHQGGAAIETGQIRCTMLTLISTTTSTSIHLTHG